MNNNKNRRVIVLNYDGSPLAPTNRFGMVRRWIASGEAKLISKDPQVIQFLQPRKGNVDLERVYNVKMSEREKAYVARKKKRGDKNALKNKEVK